MSKTLGKDLLEQSERRQLYDSECEILILAGYFKKVTAITHRYELTPLGKEKLKQLKQNGNKE